MQCMQSYAKRKKKKTPPEDADRCALGASVRWSCRGCQPRRHGRKSRGGGGARGMEKRNALGLAHASAVITAEAAEMKASPAPVMPSNDIRHLSVLAPVHRCAPNANGSSCPARPAGPLAASSALWPAASNGHNSMGGDALAHGPPVATERRATNDLVAPL